MQEPQEATPEPEKNRQDVETEDAGGLVVGRYQERQLLKEGALKAVLGTRP